jgi:membrane-associated phospholipid phosphatase
MANEDHSLKSECSQPDAQTPHSRSQIASLVEHYTFVDYATQGYLALVGLIILCLRGRTVAFWPLLLAAHVVGIGLVHALIQFHTTCRRNRALDFLRHFYPVLLYAGLYRETAELSHGLVSGFLDPFFIRLEGRVFGLQPSLAFMDRLPYAGVSELFYAAYFSYYVMIAGVGLALFVRNRRHFYHYVSVISFAFYVCYLIYTFTPVMGPPIFFQEIKDYRLPADVQPAVPPTFPETVTAGLFYRIMAQIYHTFEAPGAAFPSSHVVIAIATVFFSFRYLRPIRWPHFGVVVLLCLSTVYCRYHYVVDAVAGVLTAAALIPLGNWLYFKFSTDSQTSRSNNR